MGKLVRALSEDGSVLCSAIDTTDIVREIERLHQPTPVVTAALGRMCTAGAIMGALLKNEGDTLTLRINGGLVPAVRLRSLPTTAAMLNAALAMQRLLFRSEATEGLMFPPVLAATEISP